MSKEPQHPKKTRKQLNKALSLTAFSGQMGLTIFLFVKLGLWLDMRFNNEQKLYVVICCLVGIVISFYFLTRQLKQFHS
ncbi:MAG: AtpZ/AtpI family protein [Flavobacteriaceae bacterium]